jgi:hypothetical protein
MIQKESPLQNENANPPKKNEKFGIVRAVEKWDPQKTLKTKEKKIEIKRQPLRKEMQKHQKRRENMGSIEWSWEMRL